MKQPKHSKAAIKAHPAPKKLTPQQEKFCQCIVSGMNQSDAYRKSYKVQKTTAAKTVIDNACKLMARTDITQRVAELRVPIIAKVQLTREWVLDQLIENVQMGKALDPIIDKDGGVTGDVKQNLPAANKALELLGKEIGMFVDRKVVDLTTHEATLDELA